MSKKFKGKNCVYCAGVGISETADHVIAREFLPIMHRANLPKVPACGPCNHAKSQLEHYILTVLPFGSRHPTASSMLEAEAPRRLAGNRHLHRTLVAGQKNAWVTANGVTQRTLAIPFEGERLNELFAMVTRGLAAHHFGIVIPSDYCIGAGILAHFAESVMMKALMMNARDKISRSIGDGLISYDGVQGTDDPYLTVWRYRIYGGVQLSDPDCPGEMPDTIWGTSSRLRSQSVFNL